LIRRIVAGKPLPQINTLVDAYNLASVKTEVAIAAFDADRLAGNLKMRFAEEGEKFLGIGMNEPVRLRGGEIVVEDEEKLVAVYPYRDAEDSKVTEATKNVVLLFCGVPGLTKEKLGEAMTVASELITRFCGGTVKA
jgi:DNA/RNA-binding domain of Phe-tRNA-synthetase-like protein